MNILHLEDDLPLLEIMHTAITAFIRNVDVTQFTDSDSAAAFIKNSHDTIDIYILDIRVPGELDGIGIAQLIRTVDPHTPIIITSAYQMPPKQTLRTLNSQWMEKPWYVLDAPKTIVSLVEEASRAKKERLLQTEKAE